MKTTDERGLTAERLRSVRLAAGFTNQKKAAAHVRAETHVVGLTDSQWASYESGDPRRPFQQKHREAIEAVFGPLGDQRPAIASAADPADLIAIVRRQQAAIETLRGAIEVQHKDIAALADLVRQLLMPRPSTPGHAHPSTDAEAVETAADLASTELARRDRGEAEGPALRAVPAEAPSPRTPPAGTPR